MKLIYSTGKQLLVYDLTGPVYRVTGSLPIKHNGYHIVSDDAARDLLRTLLAEDCFTGERCD